MADKNVNDVNNQSAIEQPIDYTELVQQRAFIGEYPLETILEGIQKQFEDYINMDDKTNYVDVFYSQLDSSYDRVENDDSEEHPKEIEDVLEKTYQSFVDTMRDLFKTRLTLGITDLEAESIDKEDLEFIIRRLYEFFILGARNNFKTVIGKDINTIIDNIGDDDSEYFTQVQSLIDRNYSPLIISITPEQFLQYRGDQEIYDLYSNGQISGNFLRKYSPKLYNNEEFTVELINHITMLSQFKKDLFDVDITSNE